MATGEGGWGERMNKRTPKADSKDVCPPPFASPFATPLSRYRSRSRVNYFAKISTTTKFDKNLMCAPKN